MLLKAGMVFDGITVTVFSEIKSKFRAWALDLIFTFKVSSTLKSPVNANVSVADELPFVAPETCEIDRLGISVINSKLDGVTPLPKVVPVSDKLTIAVSRFASVNDDGLVDATDAPETAIMKLISARSVLVRFESASCT